MTTEPDAAPLLRMRNISKRFAGVQALDDVSLTVGSGEVLALVGENGAGKSTLIKVLSGAIQADAGRIAIDGRDVGIATPRDAEALGIATVYQEFNLFPDLTVAENLLFGHYPRRGPLVDWRACRRDARRFFESLGMPIEVDRPVSALSVAEKQLLEIAKALQRSARLMILDEPTAVLGGKDVDQLMATVRGLRERGVGVIFISHRLHEIFGLADRYVVLKDGVKMDEGAVADATHDHIVAKMVGRNVERLSARTAETSGEEVLRVEGLSREGVLHDISFTLAAGQVLGIAGLRGAGRTELARAVFGADPIDAGRILVKGKPVRIAGPSSAIGAGIGLLPEERGTQGLLKNLSSAQNISLVRMTSESLGVIRPRRERQEAAQYVDKLNIRVADVGLLVGTLSGGNQQKVVLAKWLEAGVSVLILDEPTRGVDVGSKREIYEIIRQICDTGVGVVLISSELPEILEMSDRILVMHRGAIAAELSRDEATEERIMTHAVGAAVPA